MLYHDNDCHWGCMGEGETHLFENGNHVHARPLLKIHKYKIFMTKTKTLHTNHTLHNNVMYVYMKSLDHGENCLNEVDKLSKRIMHSCMYS
jgi:hypothetical protein